MDSVFAESVAANAILVAVYIGYKIVNRILTSKCRYSKNDGWDFDLGEVDAANDMEKIAELLKARSIHHRKSESI